MEAVVRTAAAAQLEPRLLNSYEKKIVKFGYSLFVKIVEHRRERMVEVIPLLIEQKTTLAHLVLSLDKLHVKVAEVVTDAAVTRRLNGKRDPSEAEHMRARDDELTEAAVAWIKERLTLGTVGGGGTTTTAPSDNVKLCATLSSDTDVLFDRPVLLPELKVPEVNHHRASDWSATLRRLDPNWAQENMPTTLRQSFAVNEKLDKKSIIKQLWLKIFRRLVFARKVYKTQLMLARRAALLSHLVGDDDRWLPASMRRPLAHAHTSPPPPSPPPSRPTTTTTTATVTATATATRAMMTLPAAGGEKPVAPTVPTAV